jgi:hypothetical protein
MTPAPNGPRPGKPGMQPGRRTSTAADRLAGRVRETGERLNRMT